MTSLRTTGPWPAALLAGALALALPAWAEKPDHAGGKHKDKSEKHEQKEEKKAEKHAEKHHDGPRQGAYFDDRHRQSVHHYYASYGGKKCPPGLAKKHNGCMPPGHAKRWEVGHRLPSTVTYYTVPQPILVTLPPPPPQYRYVRVDADVLLVAIGTMMVIDGINGMMN